MSDIATSIVNSIQGVLAAKSVSQKIENKKVALVDELGLTSMENLLQKIIQ